MNETVEIDLRELLKILLKRSWLILLCAVIMGASVLVYTHKFVEPTYQASVTIYVNNNSNKDSNHISSSDLAVALRLVETYVNIIQSDTVLEKVISETGLTLSAGQIRGMLSAKAVGETEMFRVSITSTNPQMSADIANAIAEAAPTEISKIIEGSAAKIIDYAKVPTVPSAPNYSTNTVVGGAVGAVIAVILVIVMHLADVRVKKEEDLLRIMDAPVLGVIPDLEELSRKKSKKVKKAGE